MILILLMDPLHFVGKVCLQVGKTLEFLDFALKKI